MKETGRDTMSSSRASSYIEEEKFIIPAEEQDPEYEERKGSRSDMSQNLSSSQYKELNQESRQSEDVQNSGPRFTIDRSHFDTKTFAGKREDRPDVKEYELLSVFAEVKSLLSNRNSKTLQKHVDFIHYLRDRHISARDEIEKYIENYHLEPSSTFVEKYSNKFEPEVEKLLKSYKFISSSKEAKSSLQLNFDFSKMFYNPIKFIKH
jgi:hypothetical protein